MATLLPAEAVAADAPATSAASDQQLVLSVIVNGVQAPDAFIVHRRGAAVWMAAADLRTLGVPVPKNAADVALAAIPDLTFAIDDGTQTLTMTVAQRQAQRLHAGGSAAANGTPVTPNGWGATLNYDVSATWRGRDVGIGGYADATVYGPGGYAFANAILVPDGGGRVRRLDTGIAIIDPDALRRVTLGDFVAGSAGLSRPVRLAGVQWTTDFALRPDLVTFPVPTIDARAEVPSAVDVIVNGARTAAGDVKAGRFAVADVPVQTGLNTISVAVRDATGREQLQTVTTYSSASLLAPGLTAYALEAGLLRTGYGGVADRYRGFAVIGGVRRGVSGAVTLEAHGETARDVVDGGAGLAASLGSVGMIGASVAASRGAGRSGRQLTLSWERIARPISFAARFTANSAGWRDVAAANGAITRTHTLTINASLDAGPLGSLSASLIDLGEGRVSTAGDEAPVRRVDASTLAVATWSTRIASRFNLVASGGGDLRSGRSFYASAGLLLTFGARTSGFGGLLARDGRIGAQAEVVRSAVVPGDLGYSASVSTGSVDRLAGGLDYLGGGGRYGVEFERVDRATAVRASARGALVFADGGVFATDRLTGGFAIVDANGQRGVAIYRDNRPVGTTDARGKMLIANLPPYQPTRIAFDPDDLPPDASTLDNEAVVKPADRSGVPVRFAIARNSAMMLRLSLALTAVPPGTQLSINDRDDVPVGFDGAVYLPVSLPVNRLVARLPDGGLCEASFARPAGYDMGSPPVEIVCLPRSIATASR